MVSILRSFLKLSYTENIYHWHEDGSFLKVTKGVKDFFIFIKGQEGVYSSLSDDSNNLHLSFQLTHWPLGDFNLILGRYILSKL